MKKLQFLKRYRFFILLLGLNILLLIAAPELGEASLKLSWKNFLEMLTILPPIFVLMGLMDVWIPKQTMMKYMGRGAGFRGGLIAFLLGSFSAGPLYAAFPMAAMFLKKGVSLTNVFLFIGAWSTTKIPMMMFEITQLGPKFALLRFGLNLMGITGIALFIDKTTDEAEAAKIQESACGQIGKDGV